MSEITKLDNPFPEVNNRYPKNDAEFADMQKALDKKEDYRKFSDIVESEKALADLKEYENNNNPELAQKIGAVATNNASKKPFDYENMPPLENGRG